MQKNDRKNIGESYFDFFHLFLACSFARSQSLTLALAFAIFSSFSYSIASSTSSFAAFPSLFSLLFFYRYYNYRFMDFYSFWCELSCLCKARSADWSLKAVYLCWCQRRRRMFWVFCCSGFDLKFILIEFSIRKTHDATLNSCFMSFVTLN